MSFIQPKLFFITGVLVSGLVQAQMQGYWADGSGAPLRDASGQCVRSASWSAQTLHPACDPVAPAKVAPPDRVVLLPGPDGKVGAVIVQSKQGQQLINSAYGGLSVTKDGTLTDAVEDAASVQSRYGAVLGIQPARPVSFVVRFASGSATSLTPESLPVLEEIKQVLKARSAPEIMVIGHTDRVGTAAANDTLSLKRAQAVKQILIDAGLDGATIEVAGRGQREPLVSTVDQVAEPRNRRVELNVR
jgi:outer membrane protein OmpA-like peptidoglycan-associated protein